MTGTASQSYRSHAATRRCRQQSSREQPSPTTTPEHSPTPYTRAHPTITRHRPQKHVPSTTPHPHPHHSRHRASYPAKSGTSHSQYQDSSTTTTTPTPT